MSDRRDAAGGGGRGLGQQPALPRPRRSPACFRRHSPFPGSNAPAGAEEKLEKNGQAGFGRWKKQKPARSPRSS